MSVDYSIKPYKTSIYMGFHRDFPLLPFDDQRVRFNSLSFDGDLAAIEHDLDDFMDKQ